MALLECCLRWRRVSTVMATVRSHRDYIGSVAGKGQTQGGRGQVGRQNKRLTGQLGRQFSS